MNKIERTNGKYILTTENGNVYECQRWLEKKPNKEVYHVVVPKEAREICGRTYIRESYFDNKDIYEFETKTEHREGLGGGGWRSRLTTEETKRLEEAERTIEELKKIGMERTPEKVDPNSEEGIRLQIEKLKAKLEAKKRV
jgi:hypothetical protein